MSGTLQGFLWAAGGFSVFVALAGLAGVRANSRWRDARGRLARDRAFGDMLDVDDAIRGLLGAHWIVAVVVFILIVILMNQAHKVTQVLWRGTRSWTSGWTVGGWFIPVAWFVIPKLVITEIEKIGAAPRGPDGTVADGWQRESASAVGVGWWLTFVPGVIVATVGNSMYQGDDPDHWGPGYWCLTVGHGLLAASAVLCVFYVRRIVRSLRRA